MVRMWPNVQVALAVLVLSCVPLSRCHVARGSEREIELPAAATTVATVTTDEPSGVDPYHPSLLPLPTSFPATLAAVWTSVTTAFILNAVGAGFGWYAQDYTTTLTLTAIETWPASPTPYPFSVTQTVVSVENITMTYLTGYNRPQFTTSHLDTAWGTSTFVLAASGLAPTDMPVDAYPTTGAASWWWVFSTPMPWPLPNPQTTPAPTPPATNPRATVIPCGECPRAAAWEPDARCVALGLDTACQSRQCAVRGGRWWCLATEGRSGEVGEGRVCWGRNASAPVGSGGTGLFAELREPCKVWDHQVGCTPCQGVDENWTPDVRLAV